jgi:hypothetical protein
MKKLSMFSPLVVLFVALVVPVAAQQNTGSKVKVKGIILKQEDQGFRMRDQAGAELKVTLAANAKIEEKKSNPFRGSKKYTPTQLVRGLYVEVEGRGDAGALMATKIKFSKEPSTRRWCRSKTGSVRRRSVLPLPSRTPSGCLVSLTS